MSKQAAATRASSNPTSLHTTYDALHAVLMRHVPPFVAKHGTAKPELHIVVPEPVTVSGAYGGTPKQVGLAAVVLQKTYVGLYYLPLYLEPKLGKQFSPRLMKLLKGKTCFHVKQSDAELEKDINTALNIGTEYFRSRGWI